MPSDPTNVVKPDGGVSISGALTSMLSATAKLALEELKRNIRFEPPSTLFVSDFVIVQLVSFIDRHMKPEPDGMGIKDVKVERITAAGTTTTSPSQGPGPSSGEPSVPSPATKTPPLDDGFRIKAIVDGTAGSALVKLRNVTLNSGVVKVEAQVPHAGVSVDQPVAAYFLRTVGSLFGAEWRGKILSAPLKKGRQWDGETAKMEMPIPEGAPAAAHEISALMDVEHVPKGLKFVFSQGSAEAVMKVVLGAAMERAQADPGDGSWTSTAVKGLGALAGLAGSYFGISSSLTPTGGAGISGGANSPKSAVGSSTAALSKEPKKAETSKPTSDDETPESPIDFN